MSRDVLLSDGWSSGRRGCFPRLTRFSLRFLIGESRIEGIVCHAPRVLHRIRCTVDATSRTDRRRHPL